MTTLHYSTPVGVDMLVTFCWVMRMLVFTEALIAFLHTISVAVCGHSRTWTSHHNPMLNSYWKGWPSCHYR